MGRLATQKQTFDHVPDAVRPALEQTLLSMDWILQASAEEVLSAALTEIWTRDIEQFKLEYKLQAYIRPREQKTEVVLEVWEQEGDWTDSECEGKLSTIMDMLDTVIRRKHKRH